MKSAYMTLGLPGDASPEEIRQALTAAQSRFTKEHLVNHPEDMERLQSIRDAGKILLNPEMRTAHDRKLQASSVKPPLPMQYVTEVGQKPWYWRPTMVGALLVVVLFSAGGYLQYQNQERRRELAMMELEKRKIEEREAQQKLADDARREAMVAKMNADARANEDKLRQESLVASRNAEYQNSLAVSQQNQRAYLERAEAQRKESADRNAKYQAQMDAQRNLAIDQQRIRNLCMQNYGRINC
jgi:hypothetical protein|uniref:J domain-containing protein n=1 Tax=Curvibacter symbiont subsp. Hydra magnipapillata TaxID=667019 RepID=C9YE44_CURXX|nr:hypothetical protein Csp_D28500 [Curvibacter putative symbiont of Hydra magnipapillata]